jgi:tetratricopeptide (TPR) repeat protein
MALPAGSAKAQIDTDRMTIIGRNALYFEDYILAIQYFNQIIRAKPYLAEPYYYRAVGKYHLEDYPGAVDDCDKALEINPYMIDAYNLRGILYQKIEKPELAIEDYKKGLEVDPLNLNLMINLGIAYIQTKSYTKAVEIYSAVLDESPNLVTAYLNRGLAKFSDNDTIGALKDFSKAVETNPYIPDGFVNRSMIYYHQSDFESALADINNALKLRPEEASLFMNRGIIRYQLDNLRGTMNDFDKFVEMEPRNAMGYNNRGILRAEIGDLDGAINDLSRVLALRGEDLPTLYYRGMLYQEKGEFRKALSDYNIVTDAYPDFSPVYYNRAEVRNALGQEQAAQLDYNTAMKLEMDRRNKIGDEDKQPVARKESEKEKGKRKETRAEDDRNIRNYNKMAVLDDFGADQPEELTSSSLRGKIQNRNIMVDLQDPYGLTFFPGDTLVHRVRYFEKDVEELADHFMSNRSVEIANVTGEITRESSARFFEDISRLTEKINREEADSVSSVLLMERGLHYLAVQNINNSIEDFDSAVSLNDKNYLAYFLRAYARYKMVETVKSFEAEDASSVEQLDLNTSKDPMSPATTTTDQSSILDYKVIIDDLDQVIEIAPRFEFAWFNRAYMKSLLRNFDEAIEDYTRAIEINPDFAEAYFNRGLIRIYMEQTADGTMDLSKAGELGVFEAYSIIKRYGSYNLNSVVEEEVENE